MFASVNCTENRTLLSDKSAPTSTLIYFSVSNSFACVPTDLQHNRIATRNNRIATALDIIKIDAGKCHLFVHVSLFCCDVDNDTTEAGIDKNTNTT